MFTYNDFVTLHKTLKKNGISEKPSLAIAGFLGRGKQIAIVAKKVGFKVVAVSDRTCAVVDLGGNGGLDINQLIRQKRQAMDFKDIVLENIRKTKPDFLLKMEVDVLIIESLDEELAAEVRAKAVLELSKGLISKEANKVLKNKQVPIIHFYTA